MPKGGDNHRITSTFEYLAFLRALYLMLSRNSNLIDGISERKPHAVAANLSKFNNIELGILPCLALKNITYFLCKYMLAWCRTGIAGVY